MTSILLARRLLSIVIIFLVHFCGDNRVTSELFEGSSCSLYDGTQGICKSLRKCKWAIDHLRSNRITYDDIRRATCCYVGDEQIICCGDERPPPTERTSSLPPIGNGDEDDITFLFESDTKLISTSTIVLDENKLELGRFLHFNDSVILNNAVPTTAKPKNTFWDTWSPLRQPPNNINDINHGQITFVQQQQHQLPQTTSITSSDGPDDVLKNDTIEIIIFGDGFLSNTIVESKEILINTNTSTPKLTEPLAKTVVHSNSTNNIQNNSINININQFNGVGNNCSVDSNSTDTINGTDFNQTNNNNQSNDNELFPPVTRTTSSPIVITRPTAPIRINTKKSEMACQRYTKLSSPFLSFNILGGTATNIGEFPHMAALGYPSQEINSYEYEFDCGGSVISERYILTAAHCVKGIIPPTVVRMGKVTLHTNDDGTDGLTANIDEIIVHPLYRRNLRYNDIALVRLLEPIVFNDKIRPACLRTNISDINPSVELIVVGWGATSAERAQRSDILLKTNLTAVTLESCNRSILEYSSNDRSLKNGIEVSQICAYDPKARNDACQGDSGGPLQITHANGVSTLVGITSFGIACGTLLPSVYTRVAYYIDWIESIVWPNR